MKQFLKLLVSISLVVHLARLDAFAEEKIPSGMLGVYQMPDQTTDIKILTQTAEQGLAFAQFSLGVRYAWGKDVEKDNEKAFAWIRKSAEQGDSIGELHLGSCYEDGIGVESDLAEAVKWYRKAAENGNADAQNLLGHLYSVGRGVERDLVNAFLWYQKSAENGHAIGQKNLAECYELGSGVEKDITKAADWYHKAAENGNLLAQSNLGYLLLNGIGVQKDCKEAIVWFRIAANRGDPTAQSNLGFLYSEGIEVEKDPVKSLDWYRKAAEQGDANAEFQIGAAYQRGRGVVKNPREAANWYRKAAEKDSARAQLLLGEAYAQGEGVAKNDIEAYKWLLLAAAKGEDLAVQRIPIIEKGLTPQQRAEGQRLAQEWEKQFTNKDKKDEGHAEASITPTESGGPKSFGTGFMITKDGYLVTCNHVVSGCGRVLVLSGENFLEALVVRSDVDSDLAVLKIAGKFHALPVISSRAIREGASVCTFGFPNIELQGIEPKFSRGDVASLAGIRDDARYFQVSVPVQPGNSGGPLFDTNGNVVGVVAAQLNQKAALLSSGALPQGVNYAVKSSYLLSLLESVPEAMNGIPEKITEELNFGSAVERVKKATVLIIGY